MNRAISRIFVVGLILFVALIVNLTYLQVFAAESLKDRPENHRQIAAEMRIRRGSILGFDGSTIAGVQKQSGFFYRTYPQGAMAPQVVGYNSVQFGRSGLEKSMNEYLTGEADELTPQVLLDRALGRRQKGAAVRVTIVPAVQRVAQTALGEERGAIVALDPTTGAIIAAASSPAYDPGRLEAEWKRLSKDPAAPLLDRVTQGLYPPGSAFKVVTAAAALDLGKVTPETVFNDTGPYQVYGGKVTNYGNEVFGANTFSQALTSSINTTFGKVGTLLGQQNLVDYMLRFGFYKAPPVDLPENEVLASGRYGANNGGLLSTTAKMDPLAVAWAACGQEQVLATPLQMALVAAAVANGGEVMSPYLVQEVVDSKGAVLERAAPEVLTTAMDAETASSLNAMMQRVVDAGTGTGAALAGIRVAGKTGTAEKGDANQAWFIAFAPAEAPRVAVAVTIENTPLTGGDVAAPLAAEVLRAALAQPQLP